MTDRSMTPSEALALVSSPTSVDNLRKYFGLQGGRPFTGAWFERLDGGGDRKTVQERITAADILAVQTLSVVIPTEVSIDLLEGQLGREIGELLAQIPSDVALGSTDAAFLLRNGGFADRAWRTLEGADDLGWVSTSKLLARKRPRLLPVYDRVTKCAFRAPKGSFWSWLNDLLAEGDGELDKALTTVARKAGIPEEVHNPRVFDVIIWMLHHDSHRMSHCPRVEFEAAT